MSSAKRVQAPAGTVDAARAPQGDQLPHAGPSSQPTSLPGPLADALDRRQSPAALAIRRGAGRLLASLGFAALAEVPLPNGRRADLVAIGRSGEIWIVEIKSCLADFQADAKWPAYREFSDRLWFAVDADFPADVLPGDAGLIIADRFGGAVLREAPVHKLAPARAKALHLRLARLASLRLMALADPDAGLDVAWRGD